MAFTSAETRLRGSIDFSAYYETLCALQDSCPFREVVSGARKGRVVVNADRFALSDWHPLLKALQINKSLDYIAFRRYRRRKPTQEERQLWTRCKFGVRGSHPAIAKREVTTKLCRAIADCLTVTSNLTWLELEDISLKIDNVQTLSNGMTRNSSVTTFSLKYCQLGDRCLEVLSKGIRNCCNLVTVDFSGCCLTWKGAKTVAELIKFQSTQRHSQAWKDSLRQKEPNLDKMSGLRRITLCGNLLLGDKGACLLAEALEDDLWLKALDLQQCGISNKGARQLLACLEYKTNLSVLDIRLNPLIDATVRNSILLAVTEDSQSEEAFPWLDLAQEPETLSTSAPTRISVPAKKQRNVSYRGPLRTQYRKRPANGNCSIVTMVGSETTTGATISANTSGTSLYQSTDAEQVNELSQMEAFHREIQRLRVSIELCKDSLAKEIQGRAEAEARIVELEVENSRLKSELMKSYQVKHGQPGQASNGKTVLDDESTLEAVETAMKKFHAFVDLLKANELDHLTQ